MTIHSSTYHPHTPTPEETPTPFTSSQSLYFSLRSSYISALHHLRHYYSPTSTTLLLHTLTPDLEAISLIQAGQSLLLLVGLLPTKLDATTTSPDGVSVCVYDQVMPHWMKIWQSIDNCPGMYI